jgi:hypothetical protein
MSAAITLLQPTEPTPVGLVWENPPTPTRNTGKYVAIAAALKNNPGRWAVIRSFDKAQSKRAWAFSGTINRGKLVDFREPSFECIARTVGNEVRVYVRYQPVSEVPA